MSTTLHGPRAHRLEASAGSLITALHCRAEEIRRAELARIAGWDTACPDDLRRLEVLTRSLVEALLDEPIARLRTAADRDADCVESARYLFGLDAHRGEDPPTGGGAAVR